VTVPKRILIDNLRHGADVVSFDGEKVGTLHAVVVDPRDEGVTQVVVNSGPHFPAPGFGAPDLVTVPIAELEGANENEVLLRCTAEQFKELPSYVERSFFAAPRSAPEGEDGGHNILMDVGTAIANSFAALGGIPVPAEIFRKAEFERHILNDAPIWRQEPFEQLGEVERVLVNNETDEIEALVVRRGHLFPEEVVLPIEFVTEVRDGIVQAALTDAEVRELKRFDPES
jgi:sporulation protein YlmC with PRC-barrel domain